MNKKILFGLSIFLLFFLTACDMKGKIDEVKENFSNRLASVSIPFEWFYDESLIAVEEVNIPKVEGMDLITKEIPYVAWENFKKNLTHFGDAIQGEEALATATSSDHNLENILSEVNYESDMDWKPLESILSFISEVDHQYFQHFTIKAIGERKYDNEEYFVAWVDMNNVNDTEEFLIIPLQINYKMDGTLLSIQAMGEAHNSQHTATPLKEDAFLYETTHLSFVDEWEKFLKKLDNFEESDTESMQDLVNEYDMDINVNVLAEIKQHRSVKHETEFVEYMLDDQNLSAKTWYEWVISNEDGIHHYHIAFDRGKKSIKDIRTNKWEGEVKKSEEKEDNE